MEDNNYNLEYSTPMNDIPTHEEVLTKKPDYDKVSTPTPQTFDKGCQSQSVDDDNPSTDNLQQGNQTIPLKNILDSESDNNNNYHRFEYEQPVQVRNKGMNKKQKISLVLFIILILLVVGDIITEVYYKMLFTPFLLGDNIVIVLMSIIYLIFIILKKPINNLLAWSILVLGAGFVVKGIGLYLFKLKGTTTTFTLVNSILFFGKIGIILGLLLLI